MKIWKTAILAYNVRYPYLSYPRCPIEIQSLAFYVIYSETSTLLEPEAGDITVAALRLLEAPPLA